MTDEPHSIRQMMKAVVVTGHGGLDKLEYTERPIPTPKNEEVLIKIHACALNNSDIWMREGAYGTDTDSEATAGWNRQGVSFPRIPGSDISGQVVDLGENVDSEILGKKVVLFPITSSAEAGSENIAEDMAYIGSEYDGGYAEYVVWPAHLCRTMPLEEYVQSATFPVSGMTAWHMVKRSMLSAGEFVLVTGASGGVGSFVVQIASKVFGAHVIALTGDLSLKQNLIDSGASYVLSYKSETLLEEIESISNGGVDVVFDVVGDSLFSTGLAALRKRGRFVISGASGGAITQLDVRTIYLKHLSIIGASLSTREEFNELMNAVEENYLVPLIDKTFPLEQAKEAQAYFKKDRRFGKVVLIP